MTNVIKWTEEYSVGVEEIDAQHKRLISIINHLVKAIEQREKREQLETVLDEMVDYLNYHFISEERYFEGMANLKEHKLMHWDFVKKTNQLNRDYAADKLQISQDILDFLISWLNNHILKTDKKYFAALQQQQAEHGKTTDKP